MKTFDCSLRNAIPEREIQAKSSAEAKKLFLAALILALKIENIDAIEVEIVD